MAYGNGGEQFKQIAQQLDVYGANQMISAPTPARNNIGEELEGQDKRLELLHQMLGQLEQRLSPVLRPIGPSTDGVGNPAPSGSAVIESLRRSGYKMDAAVSRIQGLIDRLEL